MIPPRWIIGGIGFSLRVVPAFIAAQEPPVRTLSTRTARFPDPFIEITGFRELQFIERYRAP